MTGKIIKTISLDNKPEIIEYIDKQENFSKYVQVLIEQDIQRLKQTVIQQTEERIELTFQEMTVYDECWRYFEDFGVLKYGKWWQMFDLQIDPDLLQAWLGEVQEELSDGWIDRSPHDLAKILKEDIVKFDAFFDKISKYWLQERPIPDEWKREVIPGLTVHEALSKIIPKAINLKDEQNAITINRISEILGLTYQQTYLRLMPHIKSVLSELGIEV
jgi:hypothetical protein